MSSFNIIHLHHVRSVQTNSICEGGEPQWVTLDFVDANAGKVLITIYGDALRDVLKGLASPIAREVVYAPETVTA